MSIHALHLFQSYHDTALCPEVTSDFLGALMVWMGKKPGFCQMDALLPLTELA